MSLRAVRTHYFHANATAIGAEPEAQMGMFDMLNLRINGYDYHIKLMKHEVPWTDPGVTAISAPSIVVRAQYPGASPQVLRTPSSRRTKMSLRPFALVARTTPRARAAAL